MGNRMGPRKPKTQYLLRAICCLLADPHPSSPREDCRGPRNCEESPAESVDSQAPEAVAASSLLLKGMNGGG